MREVGKIKNFTNKMGGILLVNHASENPKSIIKINDCNISICIIFDFTDFSSYILHFPSLIVHEIGPQEGKVGHGAAMKRAIEYPVVKMEFHSFRCQTVSESRKYGTL